MVILNKTREVVKARAVKSIPKKDGSSKENADLVKHTLWNKYKDDPEVDGDVPDEKTIDAKQQEKLEAENVGEKEDLMKKKYVVPRSLKIGEEDAERHGYTRGCAGSASR